jgi:uncharacterized protein
MSRAQESEDSVTVKGLTLYGTLTMPTIVKDKIPLVLIIAGSGPTDRNCNSALGLKSDAFKKIAVYLANNGIASFRYDKRGIGKSVNKDLKESELRFDDMVNDAKAFVTKFQKDERFKKIIVAGHSEGSLVGMLSANDNCKFISIAGISSSAAEVMKTQLKGQLGDKEKICFKKLDSLKNGQLVTSDDPTLNMIFRPSAQPYLISWFKYNPCDELAKLNCQILVVNGTNDIQVGVDHANKLHEANLWSQLYIVENMNHVMIETTATSKQDQMKTYNQPELPLSESFLFEMVAFINRK